MRKAHATRHRRLATKAREVERARRIQVAMEVEEQARRDAGDFYRRPANLGTPLAPPLWAGLVLSNAAAVRLRGE